MATGQKKTPRTSRAKLVASRKNGKKRTKARGQRKIDSERAQEIQQALIREHYLSGTASGIWNQASEDAMRRYQADHGWQSKTVPDSRALITLGLGPSHDHLLNPDSAMTSGLETPHTPSLSPASASLPSQNGGQVPDGGAPAAGKAPASQPQPGSVPARDPSSPQ